MDKTAGSVNYEEALSIRVGNYLLTKDFVLADDDGAPKRYLNDSKCIGVLLKYHGPIETGWSKVFSFIKPRNWRTFLGVIWFKNGYLGANERNWVFEIYGRDHVEIAKKLADNLAANFKVKINVNLISEQSKTETRPCGFPS